MFLVRRFLSLKQNLLIILLSLFGLAGYSAQNSPATTAQNSAASSAQTASNRAIQAQTTNPAGGNTNTPKKTDSAAVIKTLKDQAVKLQKSVDSLSKISITSPAKISEDGKPGFYISIIIICLICATVAVMLIIINKAGPKDAKFPFGLPEGSINAIIAILSIIFYILISVLFSLMSPSTIATDVTKTLGTLVVAISAFYFGSKTAEQSAKAATDTLTKMVDKNDTNGDIPPGVIQQAIIDNKANWMKIYGAYNIEAGKKVTNDTTHNLNSLIFRVSRKIDFAIARMENDVVPQPIPPTIPYNYQGKVYNIPTDVQG